MSRKKSAFLIISAILVLLALSLCVVSDYVTVNVYAKIGVTFVAMLANIFQIYSYAKESGDLASAKEAMVKLEKKLDEIEKMNTAQMTPSERADFLINKLKTQQ